MLLFFKILLQILAVALAILVNYLDYLWHDKRTRRFKAGRRILFVLSFIFLIGSVVVTTLDEHNKLQGEQDAARKEATLEGQLSKLREQNDGLQRGISVLTDKSSGIIDEQRTGFVSLLNEQRKMGLDTAENIQDSANLLTKRVDKSIDLLHSSTIEIGRVIDPINEIKLSFRFNVSLDKPAIAKYRKHLDNQLGPILSSRQLEKTVGGVETLNGVYVNGISSREILSLAILPESPLFPNENFDPVIHTALNYVGVEVRLYRNTVESLNDLRVGMMMRTLLSKFTAL